ncbi:MAG: hypothetical protein ACLU6Y_01430 [Ruminococcus sp.]
MAIRSLTANSTVILDGESGEDYRKWESNKAADVDIWSLPILLPGNKDYLRQHMDRHDCEI